MLNLPLSKAAADPEFGTRGGGGRVRGEVWGGSLPLPRKICQILSKNDAFLCKIFTIFGMHPVNRGETPPPESATGQKITFVDLIRTNRPLSSKPSTQFQLCRPVQNKKKLQYPSPDPLYSTIYCSQVHRVGLNSQTAKVCSPETVNRVVKSLVTIERAAYRIEDVLLRLNLLVSLLKTCL